VCRRLLPVTAVIPDRAGRRDFVGKKGSRSRRKVAWLDG
jgi:hypothetical protein